MKLRIRKELLLSLMQVMAKADIRYYLNGICFLPDGRVAATDGHRLAVGENDLGHETTDNLIIHPGKLPTKRFNMAIIDTDIGVISLMPDCIDYRDDSIAACRVGVAMCNVIDGRYPDIDRIFPKTDPVAVDEIGVNAAYLGCLAEIGKTMNPKFSGAKLTFYGKNNVMVADISSPFGSLKYAIMPMRL